MFDPVTSVVERLVGRHKAQSLFAAIGPCT